MTGLYFDAAYVAKCYLHEPDAASVRELSRSAEGLYISALALAEVACVFHRHRREGTLTARASAAVREQFLLDIQNEAWQLLPMTSRILQQVESRTRSLPTSVFLRSGDAVHLATAVEAGFMEIWTSDRHLLAAAPHFGLKGRSVTVAR